MGPPKVSKVTKISKASRTAKSTGKSAPRRKSRRYATRWNPWLSLALTYFLGPLSLLLRKGEDRSWQLTALGCGIIAAAAAWFRPGILEVLTRGPIAILFTGVGLGLVVLLFFSAWSRAVFLAGRDIYADPHRLPQGIYLPASIGIAGLMVPGVGLLLAGHMKRAAAALWAPLLVGVSALILGSAPGVWNQHQLLHGEGASNTALEAFFLFAAATGVVGLIIWLVQGLDGFRVALAWRNPKEPFRRSDLIGGALLASVIALVLTASPSDLARNLDELAVSSGEAGLRVIPLGLGQAAMHLDPSRPLYALHLAGVHRDMGQHEKANALIRELRTRWHPYAQMAARGELAFMVTAKPSFDLVGSPANGIPFQPVNLD
jgi:hypothetical protein